MTQQSIPRIPTYEALALQIRQLGVECVFGLISDDTAMLVTAMNGAGVPFHGARHENNAVAMAEGYASATGKLAIVILGRGPATANGLHGIVYARKSGAPVLVIVGASADGVPNPNAMGPDNKLLDAAAVFQGAGVRHMTAHDPETAPQVLAHAAAAAQQGLVALLLPVNVMAGTTPVCDWPGLAPRVPAPRPAPRAAALAAAAAVLRASRRPLILAGVGAHRAGAREALIALADHIGAALATTMKAKDMFRGHPFDCGVVGSFSHAAGRRLIEQADCVLVFGAGLNQRTSSQGHAFPSAATLIQVDVSREALGRWLHCDIALVGDARETAQQLLQALPARAAADMPLRAEPLRKVLAEYNPAGDFEARHTARTIDPRTVGVELDAMLPADRNVVYDAGNFLSVASYVSVPGPSQIKQASDFASIGLGFGTALGYARATPERTTVLFVGDGAFLMSMSELETVAREDIPLVIVLMNDCAYGAEVHFLKLRQAPVALTQFPDVDYAPVAQAFGFQVATVRTVEELRALAPLLAKPDGPVFIDCKINGAVEAPFLSETAPAQR